MPQIWLTHNQPTTPTSKKYQNKQVNLSFFNGKPKSKELSKNWHEFHCWLIKMHGNFQSLKFLNPTIHHGHKYLKHFPEKKIKHYWTKLCFYLRSFYNFWKKLRSNSLEYSDAKNRCLAAWWSRSSSYTNSRSLEASTSRDYGKPLPKIRVEMASPVEDDFWYRSSQLLDNI